jgi:acyl carrier protein
MTEDEIVAFVTNQVSMRTGSAEPILPNDEIIGKLGLDSLDYAAVVLATEDAIGGELDESAVNWVSIVTVEDLARALSQHVKK